MRILPEPSRPVKWEWIYCYLIKALGVEIVLFADTSILWFLFSVGSLPYDVLERSCLPPHGKAQEHSLQDEAERLENGSSYFRYSNVEDINAFGESEWSDDGEADEDNDDSDATSGQGSDDSGGDEEEDDSGGEGKGNDGDDVDEDEDDEEEEEEDEEESDYTESSEEDGEDESLLSHARKVYTPNVFRVFEHEFRKSRALTVDFDTHYWDERRYVFTYTIEKMGHFKREHKLTAYPDDGEMNCSCNYFSYFGILCCHAIAVLENLRINEIPNCHLLKWMKKDTSNGLPEETTSSLNYKRCRLLSEECSRKCFNNGASKDDISTVYQERKEDIYKEIDRIQSNLIYLRNSRKYNFPFISGLIQIEPPKATKDDCYPLYQKKQKCNYTDNALVGTPLLWHARNIYIPRIYDLFRVEYKKSEYLKTSIVSKTVGRSGNRVHVECEVYKPGHYMRNFKVYAESDDGFVICACKKFEVDGLCSHAIAVLDCLCIVRIPSRNIVPQLVRDVNLCVNGEIHGPHYGELIRMVDKNGRWTPKFAEIGGFI